MKHEPIKLHSTLWLESVRANQSARQAKRDRIGRWIFVVLAVITIAVLAWATAEIWNQ